MSTAIIDTLSFTLHASALRMSEKTEAQTLITAAHVQILAGLGIELGAEIPKRNFYSMAYAIIQGDIDLGFIAAGGNNGSIQIHLTGKGCFALTSFEQLQKRLTEVNAKITRVDLAHDDFEGEHPVTEAVELYKLGEFSAGGRQPSASLVGDWINGKNGRTLYVGKRQNGKMIRIYEKGIEQGDLTSPWVRYEVELRSVDRVIPYDVLTNAGAYLVGAYPKVLSWVNKLMCRIKTKKKEMQISYANLVHWGRVAYGQLVQTMLDIEGDAQTVINMLARPGVPQRLIVPATPPSSNTGGNFQEILF